MSDERPGPSSPAARRRPRGTSTRLQGAARSGLTLACLLLAAVLAASPAAGLPLLDDITVETGTDTLTSTSITHETPNGSDRLLLVSSAWDDANDLSLSTVTYDGQELTCLDTAERSGTVATQMCYLVAPPTGSNTLDVTWGADVAEWMVTARSLTDVNQDTPIGATTTTNGSSTDATGTLTTGNPDSVIATSLGTEDGTVDLSPIPGTDEDAEDAAGLSSLGISGAVGRTNTTTSGSYETGWNVSSSVPWALLGVEVLPVPAEISFAQSSSSGSEANTSVSLDITMDRESSEEVTVDYETTGGNASSDDHNVSSGTVTFEAGSTSETVNLDVTDDAADEPDETLELTLKNPNGADRGSPTTHTYTIEDEDPNHAPASSAASFTTDEDTDLSDTLSATDQDQNDTIDGFDVDRSPDHGTVSLDDAGAFTYTPDADYNGDDSFTFTATDEHGATGANATVNLTVEAVNDAPDASDDSASTDENSTVWISVLDNDDDVDDASLTVDSVTAPANGTTSLPGNGTVQYTPDAGFTGDDSFDYTATDGSLDDTATVSVSVTSADNGAPSPADDAATLDEDSSVWVDVLANDTDPDGDTLSVDSATAPANGSTSLPGNGTVAYTPDADYNGDDSFDYDVTDGEVTSTATVSITVEPVDDAPTAGDDNASTPTNESVWIDVLANDGDVDGDTLSVDAVTNPANGTASLPGNGTVEYTPDPGFTGTDTFRYDVTDGSLTDRGNVTVGVGSGGDGPSPVTVLSSSVRAVNGALDGTPTVNTTSVGASLNIQLENDTGGIELADYNATSDTTLQVNLTVRNFTPRMLMGRAQVHGWSNTTNENGTENVTFELDPISMAFIDDCDTYDPFMGYCGPSSVDNWPENTSEDQADVAFDAALRVFVSDLSYLGETEREELDGGFMTTDAQAIGQMNVSGSNSTGGASLTMPVAGPHTLPNGTTNDGFFEARLPDALLSSWGIDDNEALTGSYQGANRTVDVSDVDEGTLVSMDIHYSSGDVTIGEDTTAPVADAGNDTTVTVGSSLTLDGSNSSDNQGVTNHTWDLDDNTTAFGETVNHTYDETGTYAVTLTVSDAANNTDTDTVNVTVESSGGGGGGGGGIATSDTDDEDSKSDDGEADDEDPEATEPTEDTSESSTTTGSADEEPADASKGPDGESSLQNVTREERASLWNEARLDAQGAPEDPAGTESQAPSHGSDRETQEAARSGSAELSGGILATGAVAVVLVLFVGFPLFAGDRMT